MVVTLSSQVAQKWPLIYHLFVLMIQWSRESMQSDPLSEGHEPFQWGHLTLMGVSFQP